MNPPISHHFDNPDPNANPLNVTQLVQLLDRLFSAEITGDYIPYVVGSVTPGVDDQDKLWLQQDSQKRPIALKQFWQGNWRRVYNGMLGEIRMFNGDPTDRQIWDENGMGIAGGIYDGWHICNGKNGVVDLSDNFIITAHMREATGYSGGEWKTEIVNAGQFDHTGGAREITLTEKNTYMPQQDIGQVTLGRYKVGGGGETLNASGPLYGDPSLQDETKNVTLHISSEGNIHPEAIKIIPRFIAMGYITFVGYR